MREGRPGDMEDEGNITITAEAERSPLEKCGVWTPSGPRFLPLTSLGQGEYSHYGTSSNVVDMDGKGSPEGAGSYLITKYSIIPIRTLIGM